MLQKHNRYGIQRQNTHTKRSKQNNNHTINDITLVNRLQ